MNGGVSRSQGTHDRRHGLRLRRLGIDTHQEPVIYMRSDCHVCRAEGFTSHARVQVTSAGYSIIATLNQINSDLLKDGEASLSESGWRLLGAGEGDPIAVNHPPPVLSLGRLRAKVFGQRFKDHELAEIVRDIVAGRYTDIELSSFVTVCAARDLDRDETTGLTRAMIDAGESLRWDRSPVVDKHSVGGLPGNRTTPIVVAIAAACGLTMPKTSSRAITSPAGTADTMETMAPVDLDIQSMRRVVEREGGCVVWGGAVRLSPADDVLIRIERALDIDSEGQLVASVISKKVAAGSTHIILDIPVGPTAKVRGQEAAEGLARSLVETAAAFGVHARVMATDGRQPVGRGIGPALEARDVLAVLQVAPGAPQDLRERATLLAGALLELAGAAGAGAGQAVAAEALAEGRAWAKFQRICEAQGGMREPPVAAHCRPVIALRTGQVAAIDNRRLAKVAKLAGAPIAKAAGVELHARLGARVEAGDRLFTVHAESPGELAYSLDYVAVNKDILELAEP